MPSFSCRIAGRARKQYASRSVEGRVSRTPPGVIRTRTLSATGVHSAHTVPGKSGWHTGCGEVAMNMTAWGTAVLVAAILRAGVAVAAPSLLGQEWDGLAATPVPAAPAPAERPEAAAVRADLLAHEMDPAL